MFVLKLFNINSYFINIYLKKKVKYLYLQFEQPPSPGSGDISQTDESKAQNNAAQEGTNLDDEKKQQATKAYCLADAGKIFIALF